MDSLILDIAACENNWLEFVQYKIEKQHLSSQEEKSIRDFVERKAYLSICESWKKEVYPSQYPTKRTINKQGTSKKRIVYSFPGDEGIFLKFIAFHLFRYDSIFCNNCYAFRREFGVWDAMRRIRSTPSIGDKYCLKVDISNYFNSIDIDILLSKLEFIKESDRSLFLLFSRILTENRVWENDKVIMEHHGAMAGTPISPFFANIYLMDVDYYFHNKGVLYFRYSDDILIFADSLDDLLSYQNELYEKISELKLSINPDKVNISAPGEVWEFLGFCYRDGEIDLSDTTIKKTKDKIKRKSNALRRWQRGKGLSTDKAAIGLIRAMNRKFFGHSSLNDTYEHDDSIDDSDDFTWSRWFFPHLTVDTGLKTIDNYLVEYIRYTVTGRHYKGNYRIKYNTLKEWGYCSLVHEYYKSRKNKNLRSK